MSSSFSAAKYSSTVPQQIAVRLKAYSTNLITDTSDLEDIFLKYSCEGKAKLSGLTHVTALHMISNLLKNISCCLFLEHQSHLSLGQCLMHSRNKEKNKKALHTRQKTLQQKQPTYYIIKEL